MTLRVRPLRLPDDRHEWLRMRLALWPDETHDDDELGAWGARADAATFVLERADGSLGGFVEAGARPYAEGCVTSPVGYIEGWYVDPDLRRAGHGRALVEAAEAWARAQGYREMGSDALLDNIVSHRAHGRLGYQEVERLVTFRKALADLGQDR